MEADSLLAVLIQRLQVGEDNISNVRFRANFVICILEKNLMIFYG